jgi:hypothetical protein
VNQPSLHLAQVDHGLHALVGPSVGQDRAPQRRQQRQVAAAGRPNGADRVDIPGVIDRKKATGITDLVGWFLVDQVGHVQPGLWVRFWGIGHLDRQRRPALTEW